MRNMPILKIGLRLSAYLLIAACSQSALETYGCACASRTYTVDEIAKYRADAAKNDFEALAQMEEYYQWRSQQYPEGSMEYDWEVELQLSYRARRLALNDPDAIENEVDIISSDAFDRDTSAKLREQALLKAISLGDRHPGKFVLTDRFDPEIKDIDAMTYLQRELMLVRELGDNYYSTRDRQKRVIAAKKGIKMFY